MDAEVVSATYTASVGGGDGFSIGNACSAELVIVLADIGATAGNQSLRVTWDAAGTEYPLFTGTVSKATTSGSQTTITAYDALDSASSTPYEPTLTGSCTAAEALADIAAQMGVELDADTKTLASGTALTEGVTALEGLSLSSAAANIALLLGGNAIITRAGALAVRQFTDCGWETESYAGGATPEDTAYTVDGLTFQRTDTTTSTDEDGITTESSTSTDYTASASSGAGLTYSTNLATQALVDGAYAALAGLSFRAGSFSVQGGLFVEPGDLVTVDGLTVAVSGLSLSLDGGCKTTITSLGQSDTSSTGGSITQAISAIQQDYAEFKTMVADNISATNASFTNVLANYIKTDELEATVATFGYITADSAVITDLTAEVANINSILAGNIGAGTVQTVHLTSENVVIDDAVISDAMIVDLTASKITSGTIYTSLVTIQTAEGDRSLYMTDALIAMYDSNGTQRLQAGMAYENEGYNFVIWDENGTELFNATGITASGIPSETIVNDHVAENAAISGTKLDIASVASELNKDGSLTVNAAQITIDDTTLEYRLTSMTTATNEAVLAAQAAQDMAAALESEAVSSLTQYYVVGDSAEEPPSDPATNSSTWVEDFPSVEDGEYLWTAFYVVYADESSEWTTPTCLTDGVAREAVSTLQTELEVVQGQITAKVWQTDIDTAVSGISVGGRNYLLNTRTFDGWSRAGNVTLEEDDEGYTVATWAATSTLAYNGVSSRDPIQFSLVRGQTVTLSFDIRSDDFDSSDTSSTNRVQISFALCEADSTTRTLSRDVTVSRTSVTTEWVRYTLTATLTDDYFTSGSGDIDDTTRFYIIVYNYALTSLQIRKVKLEIGNIATDWSPAPEDTEASITTLTDKYASLTLTIDGITAEVADVETAVTESYETLSERIATVEQTADGITSTVSNVQTRLNNLSVGGRNYLLNTRTFDGWSSASNVTLEEDDEGYTVATWAATDTLAYNYIGRSPIQFSLIQDQTVTLSFDIRSDDFDSSDTSSSNKVIVSLALCTADSTTRTLSRDTNVTRTSITTEWTRYTLTATLTDDYFTSGSGDIDDTTRFYIIVYNYTLTSLQVRKVKLELGTVATDWSPAPEDTEASITSAATALSSQITQTASEITDTVSALETTVSDNYTTLSDRVTTVEETADSITSTVSALDAVVADNYETLSNRITTVEQTADGITSTVSNVQTQLNNLTVGGRNYLLNTRTFDGWSSASNVTLEEDDEGYTVATWAATDTLAYNYIGRSPIQFSLIQDQTVTLSFDIRSDDFDSSDTSSTNRVSVSLALCTADSTTRALYRDVTVSRASITSDWVHYTITATLTDDYFTAGSGSIDDVSRFFVTFYNYALTSLQIRKVKLEIGNIATDWSPAPEDSENTISYAMSKIQQLADSIEMCVTVDESTGYLRLGTGDDGTVKFTIDADNITLDEDGNLAITGTVTATGGTVGGWNISSQKIYGTAADGTTTAVMQISGLTEGTAYVFAAGGTSHSSYADSPFRVNKLGQVWADRLISATYLAAGNDYGLYCLDTSGTGQRIAYLSNNDNVVLGHSDYATYINGSAVTISANLTASGTVFVPNSGIALANGYGVHHYLSDGSTYKKFEYVNASNQFLVGNSSYATYLYGSSITSSKSITTSSDRRLKEDIHPLDRPGLVDALAPVSYRLRDDPALVHYGFVAQDVEEALAELDIHSSALVQTNAATGMKSIAYVELIPLLVAEVQTLKQQVRNLQRRLCT